LGTFFFDSLGQVINRNVRGQLQLQAFHPYQKAVMARCGSHIRHADRNDNDSMLDDDNFRLFCFSNGGEIGISQRSFAIGTDKRPLWSRI